jgi:syntaxin 6
VGTLEGNITRLERALFFVAFEAVENKMATCGLAGCALEARARAARERDLPFATMGDVNDPFYLVKEEIQVSVDKAKGVTERMDRLPEYNGERVKYANAIVTECDSVKWQLEELDRATAMAERDFVRFKVDQNELASRKRWTAVTKDAVEAMRGNAQRVLDLHARNRAGASSPLGGLAGEYERGNDEYLDDQHQQQQRMLQRQDVDLEDISVSIQRIGQVGLTIGEELATQGKMLEDLEQDVEGTNSRLAAAQRKMNQVFKKAGTKGQMIIIAVLMVILIILFLIAFM